MIKCGGGVFFEKHKDASAMVMSLYTIFYDVLWRTLYNGDDSSIFLAGSHNGLPRRTVEASYDGFTGKEGGSLVPTTPERRQAAVTEGCLQ